MGDGGELELVRVRDETRQRPLNLQPPSFTTRLNPTTTDHTHSIMSLRTTAIRLAQHGRTPMISFPSRDKAHSEQHPTSTLVSTNGPRRLTSLACVLSAVSLAGSASVRAQGHHRQFTLPVKPQRRLTPPQLVSGPDAARQQRRRTGTRLRVRVWPARDRVRRDEPAQLAPAQPLRTATGRTRRRPSEHSHISSCSNPLRFVRLHQPVS